VLDSVVLLSCSFYLSILCSSAKEQAGFPLFACFVLEVGIYLKMASCGTEVWRADYGHTVSAMATDETFWFTRGYAIIVSCCIAPCFPYGTMRRSIRGDACHPIRIERFLTCLRQLCGARELSRVNRQLCKRGFHNLSLLSFHLLGLALC
jgi:hypothetical protein